MRASTILCLVILCLWVQLPALAMFEDADDIVISAPKEVSTSDAAETPPPAPTQSATNVDQVDKKEDKNKEKRETNTITHKVTRGDTLWALAKKYLGDGSRFMEIVKANAEKYPSLPKNPDLIIVGWELIIPIPGQTSGDTQPSDTNPGDTQPSDTNPGDTNPPTASTTEPITPPATTTPLTVEQKILKLQEAVNRMNMALLPQGKTLTELNPQTVRLMIDKGIITEEEWMSLNPPEGYRWVIEKGKVKLVNHDGQPITNAESAKANEAAAKEAAEKAKAEAEKAAKEAAEKAAKEKAAKEAAEKAAKEKAAKEAAEKAKAEAEKAKSHAQKNYEADLAKIGMPNILGQERAYINAIERASRLNPKYNQFSPYNQDPFVYGYYAAPGISLHTLQYQLFEAQKLYEEMVNKNATEKFLGIFGNNIESAAKKVKECRERLAKAWSDFQKVHNEGKQQVAGIKSDIAKAQEAKKAAEDKLAKLDRYNPDNGPQVQALLKEIKAKDEEIAKLQKKAGYLDDLLKLFP